LLQFVGIEHRYDSRVLFQGFSWHIKPGTRTALVGPNGVGKTTLFRIATGEISPDRGEIVKSKGTLISLFQQIPQFDLNSSVLEVALLGNKSYANYRRRFWKLREEMEELDVSSKEYENFVHELAELEDFADSHDLHNLETKARKILSGLGFSSEKLEKPVGSFSPGFRHRLALAITLLNPHNLLLLDEPTNHLDDASKDWLVEYLNQEKSSFVLVTHDPDFLNRTTRSITEIHSRGVFEFEGTLEDFFHAKEEIQARLRKQYEKEQAYLKERMEWVDRFRAKATKARQAQSVLKKLEKREKPEIPLENFWEKKPDYNFHFEEASRISLRIIGGSFQYSGEDLPVYEEANMEVNQGDKVALVGPNGAGKSTFLRNLAGLVPFTKGEFLKGPRTKIGYFSQTHEEELDGNLNLLKTILKLYPQIPEAEARTLLGYFAFSGDSVFKTVKSLSGGEKSRLRLALLVYKPTNCLLLDEPTNHLDIVVRDALKRALVAYPGSIVVISHDPEFLDGLCNKTYRLSGGKLENLNRDFHDWFSSKDREGEEASRLAPPKSENAFRTPSGDLTKSQRNRTKNRIKSLEKEISLLENELELLDKNKRDKEELLADPGFFKKRSYQLELDTYAEIKNTIAILTERWEMVSKELENLKAGL